MTSRRSARALRLFVAVYPPANVAAALQRTADEIALPPHRLVPIEQVHLTLQFIGDVDARDLRSVEESVERSMAGLEAFDVQAVRLISLPRGGRSRLVAAEMTAPAPLMEMQRRLAMRLARSPRAKSGDRFLPHITLLRFKSEAECGVDQPVDGEAFAVASVQLMRSNLKATGAVHELVREFAIR